MPYYEYRCPDNGRVVEVRHSMSETLRTWGEVVERAGTDPGETSPGAPVERLMSTPIPISGNGEKSAPSRPSCGPGCACAMDA
ncbi:MAG TPA: hypothetical protein VGA70_12980 [Longimicrobiales bacterium]|jgi:predicted nucleic acid-binding Zn ribbon protein